MFQSPEYTARKSGSFKRIASAVYRGIFQTLLLAGFCLTTQLATAVETETKAKPQVDFNQVTKQAVLQFDIPRQRADGALIALGQQADITVVYRLDWVEPFYTNALQGSYTLPDAVAILLAETGLTAMIDSQGHLIISQKTVREREAMNFNNLNSKKKMLAGLTAFFVGGSGLGLADEVEQYGEKEWLLDEIVVTASRREESLQNVGMSLSVVDPVEFTAVGLTKLSDVIAYIPGVNVTNVDGNPVGAQISIRGVGSRVPSRSGVSSATVGVYMDSIATTSASPYGTAGEFAFDGLLGDVERIEFLRGPQGTLYGASSLGGTIKYITRKPSLEEARGYISADAASTKEGGISQLYNGRFSTPLIESKLGLTVAGFFDDNRGFVDRVDADGNLIEEDADRSERYGFSGDLYYQHSDRVDFRARVLEQKVDYTGTSVVKLDPLTNELEQRDFAGNGTPRMNFIKSTFYTGVLGVQFDGAALTLTSSYVDSQSVFRADSTDPALLASLSGFAAALGGRTFAGTTTAFSTNSGKGSKKFTQEIQLTSDASESLEWMAGLYYADEETFDTTRQEFQPDGFLWVGSKVPSFYKETAVFGNLTYYVTQDFDLTVGARLSDYDMTLKENTETPIPPLESDPFTSPIKDTVDTWSFVARYRPAEDLSLYARIASGYRPAFANVSGSDPSNPLIKGPQKIKSDSLWSYEIGAKGNLVEGLFSYDIALWTLKWDDYQAWFSYSPTFFSRGNAVGGITGRGLEGSFTLHPFEGFSILSTLAYTEMTLDEDDQQLNGLKGQQLPYVPEWTFSSRANYAFTLNDYLDASVGLGVRYEDSSRSAFTDAEVFVPGAIPPPGESFDILYNLPSDSYVVVDANATLIWSQTSLSFYATNLLNKKALTGTRGLSTGSEAVPLRPRTVGVRLSMDF
jgi:iron complex outermembrane receptor protein